MHAEQRYGRGYARLVEALLEHVAGETGDCDVVGQEWHRHSNDIGRIRFSDGRVLMLKVGRFAWAAQRFEGERRAARLLSGRGVKVPRHLDTPPEIDGKALLSYWHIELPTLSSLWPGLSHLQRKRALHSWGELLARVHRAPATGCGPLAESDASRTLAEYLSADLVERLRPAVAGEWPDGLWPLDEIIATLPRLIARLEDAPHVLLHGDPHASNVLCCTANGSIDCAGLIDLEAAAWGPRENDLAHVLVLHGPLFNHPLPAGWFTELRAGYGESLDAFALRWFALYHLINLGFFSALVGDHEHAASIADVVAEAARALYTIRSGMAPALAV